MVSVIPDYTIFIQIANFLILIVILNILLYKPILKIIERREKQLDELENEIKLFNESVEKKVTEYEEKLKQAKSSAAELKKEIIREGDLQAKTVVEAVRNEIPQITQEFQMKMDKEIQAAREILKNRSQQLSVEIAAKALGRPVQ